MAADEVPAAVQQEKGIDGVETRADAASRALEEGGTTETPSAPSTAVPASLSWLSALPEQVRAVAQLLAADPAPPALPAIEATFKGKGPWIKGLPRILETLEALGGDGWRG